MAHESDSNSGGDRDRTPSYENNKSLNCRMYAKEYPEVEDLVVVQVKSIVDMGAYCSLLEYNGIEGMILMSELSRRRIRSVNRLIRVGRQEIVAVLRVNKEKGINFLSFFLSKNTRIHTSKHTKVTLICPKRESRPKRSYSSKKNGTNPKLYTLSCATSLKILISASKSYTKGTQVFLKNVFRIYKL